MVGPAFAAATMPLGRGAMSGAAVTQGMCGATTGSVIAPNSRRSGTGTLRMAFTSIQNVLTEAPISVPGDVEVVVRAVYKQVLGNAYMMDSELEELTDVESAFRITGDVREFVRAIAKSSAYTTRFFDNVSAYRAVELLFKHLLGRGMRSKAEYAEVMAVMQKAGYAAAVDWFLDSPEYEGTFGFWTVPYPIFRGLYPTNEEFNRARALVGFPGTSDKNRSSVLQYAVCSGDSPSWLTISKGLPFGTEKGTGLNVGGHWTSTLRNKKSTLRIGTKIPGGVVFY